MLLSAAAALVGGARDVRVGFEEATRSLKSSVSPWVPILWSTHCAEAYGVELGTLSAGAGAATAAEQDCSGCGNGQQGAGLIPRLTADLFRRIEEEQRGGRGGAGGGRDRAPSADEISMNQHVIKTRVQILMMYIAALVRD